VAGKQAQAIGGAAERAVVAFLSAQGCEILGVNLRVGHLELDVVARLDRTVLVVEVRSRGQSSWTSAFGSIDAKKRARVRTAGERLWDRRFRSDSTIERLRFDTASVTFDGQGEPHIEYVPAAF
jgi:putative endonuclease